MTEMIQNSTSNPRSSGFSVPVQRVDQHEASRRAQEGLAAVDYATTRLYEIVEQMDDVAVRRPSLLSGWTRGHVLTHLARNADALVNLLTWAKTGVEHQTYTSGSDRNADIERGASRSLWLLREDLAAATERFMAAAADMDDSNWQAEVIGSRGVALIAHQIPWVRLREVWVHLVDLDQGVWFDQIPEQHLELLIDDAVSAYLNRQDAPTVTLQVTFTSNQHTWSLNGGTDDHMVSGSASDVLAWLSGRDLGGALGGNVPTLPTWM